MPQLRDDNFARSVVLLLEHDDSGSFGLVLNQPSELSYQEVASQLRLQSYRRVDERIWCGGPVAPETGWVLHSPIQPGEKSAASEIDDDNAQSPSPLQRTTQSSLSDLKSKSIQKHIGKKSENSLVGAHQDGTSIVPGICLTTSIDTLRKFGPNPPEHFRIILGYAGWGPGQLVKELANGAWLCSSINKALVFDVPAELMWAQAVADLGVKPSNLVQANGVH